MQVGGGPARWHTYHQLHNVERSLRRMAPPPGGKAAEGGLPDALALEGPLLSWALPAVLRLVLCLHSVWEPQVPLCLRSFGWLHSS